MPVGDINSHKIESLETNLLPKMNKENLDLFWNFDFDFFSIFKSSASGKQNVRFPYSPDSEKLQDFRTGRDVQ